MKIVLLITLVEVTLIAILMVLWRFRQVRILTPGAVAPIRTQSAESGRLNAVQDSRWAFINGWNVTPRYDDRLQADGAAPANTTSLAGGRSVARRQHQVMHKRWSQERHD